MAERETTIIIDGEEQEVVIVDNGEGEIKGNNPPNHEKVEIVYISPKA